MNPTSHQSVHTGDDGSVYATVVTRRVYALPSFDGALTHGAPSPLVSADPADPLSAGGDLFAVARPGTDVVIKAHAHSLDGPVPTMDVSVAVHDVGSSLRPRLFKRLRVFGDRSVSVDSIAAAPVFSAPAPFVEMPLTWDRAYGGRDAAALARHVPTEVDELLGTSDLYRYPRNDVGCGYTVSGDLSALRLPNVEDPTDLLTPDRLVVRDPDHWPRLPVSAGFDAVPAHWWPRSAWLGLGSGSTVSPDDFSEVRDGAIPAELVACESLEQLGSRRDRRWFHTAAPGLWCDTLRGDETVVLTGMHPRRRQVVFTLPDERPQVTLRAGTHVEAMTPSLRTVEIDVEAETVALVWTTTVALPWVRGRADVADMSHEIDWQQR